MTSLFSEYLSTLHGAHSQSTALLSEAQEALARAQDCIASSCVRKYSSSGLSSDVQEWIAAVDGLQTATDAQCNSTDMQWSNTDPQNNNADIRSSSADTQCNNADIQSSADAQCSNVDTQCNNTAAQSSNPDTQSNGGSQSNLKYRNEVCAKSDSNERLEGEMKPEQQQESLGDSPETLWSTQERSSGDLIGAFTIQPSQTTGVSQAGAEDRVMEGKQREGEGAKVSDDTESAAPVTGSQLLEDLEEEKNRRQVRKSRP